MRNPVHAWRSAPTLVRFLLAHAALGFGLSAVFVGGFVMADPHGAGRVLVNAAGHWWPVAALWFFTGLTFGSVQIGAATMLLDDRNRPGPGRGTGAPTLLAPALLRVRARR